GVGDALTEYRRLAAYHLLTAGLDKALDHHPGNKTAASLKLAANIIGHIQLALVLFSAVAMAQIHHHVSGQAGGLQALRGAGNAVLVVIGLAAATQNHMAIRIAVGLVDAHLSVFIRRAEN